MGGARVAWKRLDEADDDELATAYYCANMDGQAYDRRAASRAYAARVALYYRKEHVQRGIRMVLRSVGLNPRTRLSNILAWLAWNHMQRNWLVRG